MECALLLYGAFGKNDVSTVVALVLIIIVEIVPAIALIATMRQPPNPSAPDGCMGDVFWFCFAEKSYFAMTDSTTPKASAHSAHSHSGRPDSFRQDSSRKESHKASSAAEQRLGTAALDPAPPEAANRPSSRNGSRRSTAENRLGTAFLMDDDD